MDSMAVYLFFSSISIQIEHFLVNSTKNYLVSIDERSRYNRIKNAFTTDRKSEKLCFCSLESSIIYLIILSVDRAVLQDFTIGRKRKIAISDVLIIPCLHDIIFSDKLYRIHADILCPQNISL